MKAWLEFGEFHSPDLHLIALFVIVFATSTAANNKTFLFITYNYEQ